MAEQSEQPSNITNNYWVWAEDPERSEGDPDRSGKWQIYIRREHVDDVWRKVSKMVEDGLLGPAAKVSTAKENPNSPSGPELHVVIVYAVDWRDLADLRRILGILRDASLAQGWIHFKRDRETRSGAYLNRGSRGVSVWNAAPGGCEISTKWITGKRVVVNPENEGEVIEQIEAQDTAE